MGTDLSGGHASDGSADAERSAHEQRLTRSSYCCQIHDHTQLITEGLGYSEQHIRCDWPCAVWQDYMSIIYTYSIYIEYIFLNITNIYLNSLHFFFVALMIN